MSAEDGSSAGRFPDSLGLRAEGLRRAAEEAQQIAVAARQLRDRAAMLDLGFGKYVEGDTFSHAFLELDEAADCARWGASQLRRQAGTASENATGR